MVGIVAVIVKLMPKNPDVDVAGLQGKARKVLEKKGAKNISFEINELAFIRNFSNSNLLTNMILFSSNPINIETLFNPSSPFYSHK